MSETPTRRPRIFRIRKEPGKERRARRNSGSSTASEAVAWRGEIEMTESCRLAFLGFGNVGRALAQLLEAKSEELAGRYGIAWRLTGVARRRRGRGAGPRGHDVAALPAGRRPGPFRAPASRVRGRA